MVAKIKISNRIIAIIPARGGSRGLPKKNIRKIQGKHLIGYTIEAALGSKYIHKTIISSDDDQILAISRRYGADILKRPASLATDRASTESVVRHAILLLLEQGEEYELLILLQPTSPLRGSWDIDKAIELLIEKKANGLISVYESDISHHKAFVVNQNGFLEGLMSREKIFKPRQEKQNLLFPNGAIYLCKIDMFLQDKFFLVDKTIHYLMPKERSLDIDTLEDLRTFKRILKKNENS